MKSFFSSPSGGRQSRKQRLEQAKRATDTEKGRRRNFGFLKTGDKKMSTVSMHRTREHAKQLAMAYSEPIDTPKSTNSGQGLLSFEAQETFDPFGNGASDYGAPSDFAATVPTSSTHSRSRLDQHFAKSSTFQRDPPAPTQETSETASMSSSYDMDFLSSRQGTAFPTVSTTKANKKKSHSLNSFVESTRSPSHGPGSFSGASLDRQAERSVISMPTFPSNSSMQANFAKQGSFSRNVMSPSKPSSSAAARRRMRNQMRNNTGLSVNSSFDDASSFTSSMTPESSTSSMNASNPARNRLGSYQRGQSNSFYSANSSVNNSVTSNHSGSESNVTIFDSKVVDGGFTFDAFGLDQSQVEREVNEAMQDLAGQGMPGFSVFFNDSDSEFPSQNWDSPANSRRSSPAPSDSESEGFVDGFRVAQNGGQGRQAYPPAPPQSFSSPGSRRVLTGLPRGSSTPPRWEGKTSSVKKPLTKDDFNSPVSNPWKDDPWGSGNEGGAFSDSGTDSDFGGTRSEIVTSFQAQVRSSPFQNIADSKSDIGTPTAYRKSVGFHQDPRLSTGPDPNEISESSGSSEQMQAELAQEFAQEFVKRVSPRHANSSPAEPQFDVGFGHSPSPRYSNGHSFSPSHSYRSSSPRGQSYRNSLNNSVGGSEYSGRDSLDPPEDDLIFEDSPMSQSHSYGRQMADLQREPEQRFDSGDTPSSRFSSFRSKYESSRVAPANKAPVEKPVDATGPTKYTQGSLRDSYAAARNRSSAQHNAPVQDAGMPQWPESPQPQNAIEESDKLSTSDHDSKPVSSLRSKLQQWETKGTTQAPSPLMLRQTPSTDSTTSASRSRASECHEERTSFASLRERLRPSASREEVGAKSDVGAGYRSNIIASVAERYKRTSPIAESPSESRSDTGASPSFLAKSRLRKVGSPAYGSPEVANSFSYESPEKQLSYRERQSEAQTPERKVESVSSPSTPASAQTPTTPERKLTYRERRELALKREQEEKEKLKSVQKETPKKDVAALIRKRIAANKQKSANASVENKPQAMTDFRSALKPTGRAIHSPRAAASPLNNTVKSSPIRNLSQPKPEPTPQQQPILNEPSQDKVATSVASPAPVVAGTNNVSQPTDTSQNVGEKVASPKAPFKPSPPAPEVVVPAPAPAQEAVEEPSKAPKKKVAASNNLAALFAGRAASMGPPKKAPTVENTSVESEADSKPDVKAMLNGFLGAKLNPMARKPPAMQQPQEAMAPAAPVDTPSVSAPSPAAGSRPALKDDPKYERYFRMLKVGMPMDVVKHAMAKDGNDPSVMDGDHNQPVGLPLKEDPKYAKYFKMLKMGISMPQVKHAMERDGLMPEVMDQDHNLPASACEKRSKKEPKEKDTHRRARLHWKTLQKITRNSLWSKIEKEPEGTEIDFDEEEFRELFQADLVESANEPKASSSSKKKGAAVRVIDAKRANNGGIILARVKMSHDEMADVVDRIDGDALSAEQIENIIEFLPTKDERKQLEKYMLEGGEDAAQKFDGLCECEKFMVSMMTVKHAKRKVRALLFKLQFMSCLQSIAEDAGLIEDACEQLKHSTRLRQLLGIVLQFGNRLNTAGKKSKNKAGAFTLDSLLKLSQAKAFDKKTTFLHYVVMIVHRNNQTLLNFTDDLTMVMKADKVYWDQCLQDLEEVENQLENVRRISLHEARSRVQNLYRSHDDDESLGDIELTLEEEVEALRATPTGLFTLSAIKQVSALRDKVEATRTKFVRVLEYFGEDDDSMQPHELFSIFSAFGRDFNKAKEEAFANMKKKRREERRKAGHTNTTDAKHGKPPSRRLQAMKRVSATRHASGVRTPS